MSVSSPHTAIMILLCPWLTALCTDELEYSLRWHIGPPLSDTVLGTMQETISSLESIQNGYGYA